MYNFPTYNVAELLGFTAITKLTDDEVWNTAITPQVRSVLGEIIDGKVFVSETSKGLFLGDEAANQNDHRLYGGKTGFLRFPFVYSCYRTTNGLFTIKRDGVKIEVFGWFGNPDKVQPEMIFQFGLRDRCFDGTKRANCSALVHFPYDHPEFNKLLQVNGKNVNLRSLETSLYSFFPGSRIGSMCGDKELETFVGNPYSFIDRPELFLKYFEQMWKSDRFPGQIGATFPDSGKNTHKAFDKLALSAGYDMLETCPSHLHVLRWNMNDGYVIIYDKHRQAYQQLEAGIKRIKAAGVKLTRQQESWVCVLQSLPRKHIKDELYLGGVTWPQDNIGPENLWILKALSQRAREDLSPILKA